jgi:hypothetical protein
VVPVVREGAARLLFERPTDTTIEMHIFVADKGDYYTIADGLPQHEKFPTPHSAPK